MGRLSDLEDAALTPLRDLVLLEWIPNTKTDSGIFIPTTDTFEYVKGRVIGKGHRCKYVEIGDRVMVEKYATHYRINYHGELHAFVAESAIMCAYE